MTSLSLAAERDPQELLQALKGLKNSLIGNIPRKVDLANDGFTLKFLLKQIQIPSNPSAIQLQIANESSIIISSIASVGPLVLHSLLSHGSTFSLLSCLQTLVHSDAIVSPKIRGTEYNFTTTKLIPNLAKALRNVYAPVGEVVYGRMSGIGIEMTIVETGWEMAVSEGRKAGFTAGGVGTDRGDGGMEVDGHEVDAGDKKQDVGSLARQEVQCLFEFSNLTTLVTLITQPDLANPATINPIYHLLSHLTQLSSQRRLLTSIPIPGQRSQIAAEGRLIRSVLDVVLDEKDMMNGKVKQAGLQLLGTLTRGEKDLSWQVWEGLREYHAREEYNSPMASSSTRSSSAILMTGYEPLQPLVEMMESRTGGLTANAIGLLTNIIKNVPSPTSRKPHSPTGSLQAALPVNVFPSLIYLLSQGEEEQITACFTLSYLLSESAEMQAKANEEECIVSVISVAKAATTHVKDQDLNEDTRTRLQEGCLLCMASLALTNGNARSAIIDANLLPMIKSSLSHVSYGLRAAACQVVRALSRSTSILRTSLIDSGIGDEIVKLLKDEEPVWKERHDAVFASEIGESASVDARIDTVMTAATATICNLITEFSPVQASIIDQDGIELLVRLSRGMRSDAVRTNALWALRNLLYKNDLKLKKRVMDALTFEDLWLDLYNSVPDIRIQGFALLRNLVSEGSEEEIDFVIEGFRKAGHDVIVALEQSFDTSSTLDGDARCEILEQAIFTVHNIALGNARHREAVLGNDQLMEMLAMTLLRESSVVLVPTLGCFLNLLETNERQARPRHDALLRVQLLDLLPKLRPLQTDPTFDVRYQAGRLLTLLESPPSGRDTRAV